MRTRQTSGPRSAPTHKWRQLHAAAAAAALAVLALGTCCRGACTVRFDVDAPGSPLLFSSTNALARVNSTNAPLTSSATFNASVPRGFAGALYATSASIAACPAASDRAGWLAAWPSFTLTSAAPSASYSQPLTVYPDLHLGKTVLAGLGGIPPFDYNVSDVAMDIRLDAVTALPGQSGNFTGSLATKLVSGWLSSQNTVTGSRNDNIQNLTANASSTPLSLDLRTGGGLHTLVLELSSLPLTYAAVGLIQMFATWYNSYANYTLTGRLRAKAILDCPAYCGDFGRCVDNGNGTASCACECGWAAEKGQCAIPWGYCAADGSQQVTAVAAAPSPPPPPPAPSPSPGAACPTNANATASTSSVAPVDGACPSGYDWDSYGTRCNACPSGFSGSGCVMCNSDAACKESLGSSTAQCSLSPLYRPRTSRKHYACQLLDPTVAGIVGSEMDFTCSTTKPDAGGDAGSLVAVSGMVSSSSPVGSTPYCSMSFRLSGMPRDASVVCTGWGCSFGLNSSKASCPVIKCECPKGCSNADGTITEAVFTNLNSAVRIACGAEAGLAATSTEGSSACRIELTGLPIAAIPASCAVSECIDPVNGTVAVTTEAEEEKRPSVAAPVIAWVPTMVLALAAAAAAAAAASYLAAAGPPPRGSLFGPAAAPAVVPLPYPPYPPPPPAAGAAARPVAEGVEEAPEPPARPLLPPLATLAGPGPSPHQQQDQQPHQHQPHQQQQQEKQEKPDKQVLPGQLVTPSGGGTPARGSLTSDDYSGGAAAAGSVYGSGNGNGGVKGGGSGGKGAPPGKGAGGAAVGAVNGGVAGCGRPVVRELSWHGLHVATRPHRPLLAPWRTLPGATLLDGVSGRAASGEVLGILGPSGSGKTTLLNVLAGLTAPGSHWATWGSICLDGLPLPPRRAADLAALVGHVPQQDMLARSLTVAECVAASAALRMGAEELRRGRAHVQSRVAAVLSELGIAHLADRVVWPGGGAPLSAAAPSAGGGGGGAGGGAAAVGGLSGGERLRVSTALELVSDPPILLLDEPLSGLDAATARATMAVLRRVAAGGGDGGGGAAAGGGRVVVASLHQPSPGLFGGLDAALLMAAGRVAYAGPPAGAAAALAAAGLAAPPPGVALAEHLLDVVVADPRDAERLCDYWRSVEAAAAPPPPAPPAGTQLAPPPAPGAAPAALAEDDDDRRGAAAEAAGGEHLSALLADRRGGGGGAWLWRGLRSRLRRFWLELGVVVWRSGADMLRNPAQAGLHVGVSAAMGLLVGGVFSGSDLNVSGAQNRVGAIFFAVMLLACFATSAVDGVFPERPLADRDLLRASHGVAPYLAAKLVLDGLLLRLLPAWVFGLPFYWLMGLRSQAAAFFTFMGAFTTMSCLAGTACLTLSFLLPSPGKTVLLLNLLLLLSALFSGFLANKSSIVPWLKWIVYISPIRYCWEALVINELEPLVLTFSSPDLPQGLPAVKGSLFLSLLGVQSGMLTTDLIVLGCMYAILAIMATAAAALRLARLRGRWP